ncbi:hypothetical protein MXB_713 [Myxobolus squamalis]|nr:hypothetical protein MXB_713 [Myxobolus squamalis]
MKTEVYDTEVAVPDFESDGCKSPSVNCPIKKGSTVSYTTSFVIPNVSSQIKSISTLEMLDEKGNHLICMKKEFEISTISARKRY